MWVFTSAITSLFTVVGTLSKASSYAGVLLLFSNHIAYIRRFIYMADKEFGTLHCKNADWRFCCSIHALYKIYTHTLFPDSLLWTKLNAIHKATISLWVLLTTAKNLSYELHDMITEKTKCIDYSQASTSKLTHTMEILNNLLKLR